jgi:DNA-binding PadR family transcriptional regulator
MGRQPSQHATLILSTLTDGARHGYGMRKEVEARTAGEIRLGSTSLYRILGQLLDEGLIEEGVSGRLPPHDDERRRYYRITPAGRRALAEDLRYLERVLRAARATGRSL